MNNNISKFGSYPIKYIPYRDEMFFYIFTTLVLFILASLTLINTIILLINFENILNIVEGIIIIYMIITIIMIAFGCHIFIDGILNQNKIFLKHFKIR